MTKRNNKTQSGQLRIVAGNWRGRLLQIADVPGLRPTSERIRETLFNWLAPSIHGTRCLDLCAGTGALGLEALSRGAAEAVFVEKSPIAERQLRLSIQSLGAQNAHVIAGDARSFLQMDAGKPFQIIFLDPPFAADMLSELCRLLAKTHMLAPQALLYLELEKAQSVPNFPADWTVAKNKTAGGVRYMLVETSSDQEWGE